MPCITLSSDLGLQDPSVGMVKGILMQHVPTATVIDLTHALSADYYASAAYALERAYRHFPRETVHLVLYDVFSQSAPRMLHVQQEGYHFLFPDNGLLPLVLKKDLQDCHVCYEPEHPVRFQQWVHKAASICHTLFSGVLPVEVAAQKPITAKARILSQHASIPLPSVDCTVLYIDHFGNVVLDITRQQFDAISNGRAFRIGFRGVEEVSEISDNYYEVDNNDKMCRFNQTGYLEIAMRQANASQLLGMKLYNEGHLLYRHVKITFS